MKDSEHVHDGTVSIRSKGRLIKVFVSFGDQNSPVYAVPTGSALHWTTEPADLGVEGLGLVEIRLRRGNELVDLFPLPLSKIVHGTTEELPRLSPGEYAVELNGYRLGDNGRKVPVLADGWDFRVGEPGTQVLVAD